MENSTPDLVQPKPRYTKPLHEAPFRLFGERYVGNIMNSVFRLQVPSPTVYCIVHIPVFPNISEMFKENTSGPSISDKGYSDCVMNNCSCHKYF